MKVAYLIVLCEYGVDDGEYFSYENNRCIILNADEAYTYAHEKEMELKRNNLDDAFVDQFNWCKRFLRVRALELVSLSNLNPIN